jgi:hypothetical protein
MPLSIVLSGANGLLGSALTRALKQGGHRVKPLARITGQTYVDGPSWEPAAGRIDIMALEGFDAVIHLAGESVSTRWSEAQKAKIRSSRVDGTALLCDALSKLEQPPKVLLSASAIGLYGDRGEEELSEESAPGAGFLAGVCQDWEKATAPAQQKGIRTVHMRIGVVLSSEGGALQQMAGTFKKGLGGKLGSGKQYMSWISRADCVSAIMYLLSAQNISGAVNLTAPNPATNGEFTKALGAQLGRPTFLGVPGFMAKLFMGEMAQELVLSSAKVLPKKLQAAGFQFSYPTLAEALQFEMS